jgi:hypothetical protein
LARGDRKWSLNEEQIPNCRVVRVHVSTGYSRGEGIRRTWRNGLVSSPPTRNPNIAIRHFCGAVYRDEIFWRKGCHLRCSLVITTPNNPLSRSVVRGIQATSLSTGRVFVPPADCGTGRNGRPRRDALLGGFWRSSVSTGCSGTTYFAPPVRCGERTFKSAGNRL